MRDILAAAMDAVAAIASVGALLVAALNLVWNMSQRRTELRLTAEERSGSELHLRLAVANHDQFDIAVLGVRLRRPRDGQIYHRGTPPGQRAAGSREVRMSHEIAGQQRWAIPLDLVGEPAAMGAGIELDVLIEPRFPMVRTRWHRVRVPPE